MAVKSAWHCAYDPSDEKHFANTYDGFWRILGGKELPGRAWHIALPFTMKPLADVPSKHRKRAALRREHWRVIEDAAGLALRAHIVQAGARIHAPPDRQQQCV
jgi:uncharacterized protein VirK/YbjX